MSVNYKSALIYGCDCSNIQDEWSTEACEKMMALGYDVISDCYDNKFLYIGKTISETECFEEARVNCLDEMEQAIIDLRDLIQHTPWELKKHLPICKSLYHICYAT